MSVVPQPRRNERDELPTLAIGGYDRAGSGRDLAWVARPCSRSDPELLCFRW
jgi:hypothetical protein